MKSFDSVNSKKIVSGENGWLTPDIANTLANHPLDCVEKAYPHVYWSVETPDETIQPTEDHPVFYGCFDWHSAVHSHWSLIRQLRLIDGHPRQSDFVESCQRRFTKTNVEREVEYFNENQTFEKPYGWAWLLRLDAELYLWDDERADDWQGVLMPLESQIVELVKTEFLTQDRPFRVGTHGNSAFALLSILDYARVTANESLETTAVAQSRAFFLEDRDAPVEYEPFGWDFLSPSLTELDLMRRVLEPGEFTDWTDRFLPDLTTEPYDSILQPVSVVSDPDEELSLHLIGLNLSKAWCMAGIASSLANHPYVEVFEEAAFQHVEDTLRQAFTEEYAGSHWLSTFVLYLITWNAGGINP